MVSKTPQFEKSQGNPTVNLDLVTTLNDQVLKGNLVGNIVDVQVNINGAGFVSDPSLIEFDTNSNTFTIPNRNVFPEGLTLDFGNNTIEVRSIDTTGAFSSSAIANITVLRPGQIDLISEAPSGLRVRRKRDSVELIWAETDIPNVKGYHIYASSEEAGGSEGYVRVNKDLITTPSFQEERLVDVTEDSTFFNNNFGQLRIRLTEEDFTGQEIQTVQDSQVDTSLSGPEIKVTTSVESVRTNEFYSFTHDRRGTSQEGFINNEFFTDIPDDEPLFYVMSTVVFDPVTNQEIESAYSSELVGIPLEIDTQLRDLPRRTRFDVTEDYIDHVLRVDNEISVIPGSVSRDIIIDPFATEAERLYFISDFVGRTQSFPTLLVVDELTSYKEALASAFGFTSIQNIQDIIDDAFDKLASNTNTTRLGSNESVGTVTFWTSTEPQENLVIEEGTLVSTEGSEATFRVTSRVTLPFADRESFYNLQRRRWEINANIVATQPGERGNVPSGSIRRVIGGGSGLQVNNFESTRFGRDEESNQDLAERSMLSFASVDAGTESGYLASALSTIGVFRSKIVGADHPLMMRDYDDIRNKHIGGKVDVWVQGERRVEVEDTFALRFQVERNIRFFLDSSPSDYIFVVDDDRVSPESPIDQLLGETTAEQAQGFSFRNVTSGQVFDLTDHSVISYNRIQLNTNIQQPAVGPNDIVAGDFRFREEDEYIFTRQPVLAVNSIQSINTSDVLEDGVHYNLLSKEDPLLEGRSPEAKDRLIISENNNIPSGQVFLVNDERHVLVGNTPANLTNLGVNIFSVRVFALDGTEYKGPQDNNPDFFLQEGDETLPTAIIRNENGNIEDGEEIRVDYEHDENFEISYVINEVLADVQRTLESQRHITADVLAKQAINNPLELEMTVILTQGASRAQVDREVRTNISQLLNSKGVGKPIHQSDVVRVVENTPGVDYVIVPFARMSHSEGNLIAREDLDSSFIFLETTPANVSVYGLQNSLDFATVNGGGEDTQHSGVFQDNQSLSLVNTYSALRSQKGRALLIGNNGLIINGYSDDQTLLDEGFLTPESRQIRRRELTANRVFLTTDQQETPEDFSYKVTYQVGRDLTSRSTIELADISFGSIGNLSITYN